MQFVSSNDHCGQCPLDTTRETSLQSLRRPTTSGKGKCLVSCFVYVSRNSTCLAEMCVLRCASSNESINESMNQSINQSVNQSINIVDTNEKLFSTALKFRKVVQQQI